MQNNNLHYNPLWIYIFDSVNDIEKIGIPQVMKERVTAIVCGSPEIACYVERVLSKNNTVVPDEISLISIGDENELEYVGNGITAVLYLVRTYRSIKWERKYLWLSKAALVMLF